MRRAFIADKGESTAANPPAADRSLLLSTLWVFAVLNYLYCDVVSLMDSSLLQQYLTGTVEGMKLDQTFLFLAALLMEVSIAMTLLSRLLPPTANRWANIAAGAVTTAVQSATLLSPATAYYLFFSVLEIGATAAIVVIAAGWRPGARIRNTRGQRV